jgi:hypothetical protein
MHRLQALQVQLRSRVPMYFSFELVAWLVLPFDSNIQVLS